jgi:putative aldouronate transport system substrate-binding protein
MHRAAFLRLVVAGVGVGVPSLVAACTAPAPPSPPAAAPTSAPPTVAPTAAPKPTAVVAAPTAVPTSVPTAAPTLAPTSAGASATNLVGGVRLPTYIAAKGPKPDLPSTGPGVDDGYLAFPRASLYKSVQQPPGEGGDVSVLTLSYYPPFTPLEQNPALQEINKQLNVTLHLNMVAPTDYLTRFNTTIAGGSLPDLMFLGVIPNAAEFLQSQCADLTPYVSGDAIKDYPNLANLPPLAWKSTVYNGAIMGVPPPRSAPSSVLYVNRTRYDQEIGNTVPKNADDWKRILVQMTNPQADKWAVAAGGSGFGFGVGAAWYPGMFGAPNMWGLEPGGKLVHQRETEQFKSAVGYVRDLFAAGVYHPNSGNYGALAIKDDHVAGKFAFAESTWTATYPDFWHRGAAANPPVAMRIMPPFTFDGNGSVKYFVSPAVQIGYPLLGITVLKKASEDRIRELLGVLNFLAAPFGSQEALLIDYGVEGADYTFDEKGNPVPTQRGPADSTYVEWNLVMQHLPALYDAAFPEFARVAQGEEQMLLANAIQNPTLGYYSATNLRKGATLDQNFNDGVTDVITGRRPLTDFDQIVKDWAANGGDQIRQEYLESMTKSS